MLAHQGTTAADLSSLVGSRSDQSDRGTVAHNVAGIGHHGGDPFQQVVLLRATIAQHQDVYVISHHNVGALVIELAGAAKQRQHQRLLDPLISTDILKDRVAKQVEQIRDIFQFLKVM